MVQALRAGVDWGQEQFQLLLQESQGSEAGPADDAHLEELRYRWMLHKSKLKDVGDLRARASAKVRGPILNEDQQELIIKLILPIPILTQNKTE